MAMMSELLCLHISRLGVGLIVPAPALDNNIRQFFEAVVLILRYFWIWFFVFVCFCLLNWFNKLKCKIFNIISVWFHPKKIFLLCSDISVSDPLFAGEHSYMSLTLDSAVRFNTELSIEIRPDSLDGLVVHFGQSRDARWGSHFKPYFNHPKICFKFLYLFYFFF